MKRMLNRIRLHSNCIAALFLLCPLLITGCGEYSVTISSPDNDSTFEEGDAITFHMTLFRKSLDSEAPDVIIEKGTVIQWKSNIDGELWNEAIRQSIPASDHDDAR